MAENPPKTTEPLSASRLSWTRLRRLLLNCGLLVCAVGGTVFYVNGGVSGIMLHADGFVLRERVAIAPTFEGRVAEVFVRPGDHVEEGQKIAVVKSVAISRSLADLAAEKARLMGKVTELQARRQVITDTLPFAKSSATQTAVYLNDLNHARTEGLAVDKSLQEMTTAALVAFEHVASLKAELGSLSAELEADQIALGQAASAYDELSTTYANGVLYAPASGDIGASVAPIGQALSAAGTSVADIFTGQSFVLAYVRDAYLASLSEGAAVGVVTRNETLSGLIDRILPLTEALPSDFQTPNRTVERGRLVRVVLTDPNHHRLAIGQRVKVRTCFVADCHAGVLDAALEQTRTELTQLVEAALSIGLDARHSLSEFSSSAGRVKLSWSAAST